MNYPVNLREIVLVDDEPLALASLKLALGDEFEVHCFTDPASAQQLLCERTVDLVILDLNFPRQNGLEILKKWKELFPEVEIVFCSGESSVARAIECLRQGASDYIVKPFSRQDLLLIVRRALEKSDLKKKWEKTKPFVFPRPVDFIGESNALKEVLAKIDQLAGQIHLNILILGESGTGKEVIARLLHQREKNAQRPFIVANMAAIPATLMESELFGVEKGAFTDAKISRAGKFEQADGGDIFLDEVGDLPFDMQAKILRVLQERQVERVGSSRTRRISFRLISATNRPLASLMTGGGFREDLIYRLSDLVLWLPPLREHPEDIPLLARHFVRKYVPSDRRVPEISPRVIDRLVAYHWPGNVRQLESTIKRALIFNRGDCLENVEIYDPTTFNPSRPSTPMTGGLVAKLEQFERTLIEESLRRHRWNREAVMEELELSKATFYRKLSKWRIPVDV